MCHRRALGFDEERRRTLDGLVRQSGNAGKAPRKGDAVSEPVAQAPGCVVVVLTFNSASILRETLNQAKKVSEDVFVVDSGSTDDTLSIARELRCEIAQRPFVNYGDQRNWAIDQVNARFAWQLHLDADEVLDDEAVAEIWAVVSGDRPGRAFLMRRRDYFLGRMLRFSGVNPWHLRLFRSGAARCEDRLYDQHFVSPERVARLRGLMHDRNSGTLTEWVARHNRWSDLEAQELLGGRDLAAGAALPARLFGDGRERARFLRRTYYRLPSGARAVGYFCYRYFVRLGFLDGTPGFYFAFFQALWFRMLLDAKIYERMSSTNLPNEQCRSSMRLAR